MWSSSASGRAQVEPLAALAAVFAVCVGLSLYVGALDATLPMLTPDREVAPTATERLIAEASTFGAVTTSIDGPATEARPNGYGLNATLQVENSTWDAGETVPESAECERRELAVRIEPGRVKPGQLEVCVWTAV